MIVKASAGTGKTYRLALEYISRLLLGEDYNEILFMTFTRAATAELKERIFEFLEQLSHRDEDLERSIKELYPEIQIDLEDIKDIKRKLLQNKDKIRIYTIDSFIGQIFKKAIGPSLNIYSYSMANNIEAEEVYKEVFSKIIDGNSFVEVKEFLEKTADREVEKYISLIKKISEERWKFSLLKDKDEDLNIDSVKKELYRNIVEIFEILKELAELPKKEFVKSMGKATKLIDDEFQLDFSDSEEVIRYTLENSEILSKEKYYNGTQTRGESLADFKERLEETQTNIWGLIKKIVFITDVLPYEQDILKIEKITRKIYDDIKFREKKLTFSDITNYTSEYLEDKELDLIKNGEVTNNFYEIIGGKITTLFLDEAQDTSVSQWKVIEPIAKACDNIIIVGDEKQSIYSWRGGNKGLFLNFDKILDGKISSLSTNYRSEKKVIDFINVFFSSISENYESVEEEGWSYKEVRCSKKDDKGFVAVMVDLDLYEEIAVDIKNRFTRIGEDKTINYRGIGIVARTKDSLSKVGENLKRLKVPYIMENSLSIVNHLCIQEMMRLFRFFIHNDFMTLLEFFRKTLNLGEEDLKYCLENRKQINNYIVGIEDKKEIEENIKIELDKIIEIRKTPYDRIGRKVIKEYSFSTKYSASRDIKNINYFLELMDQSSDIASFMKYIEDNSDSLKQIGISELNSVVLMTIHGSKGLDFHTEYMLLEDRVKSYKLTGFSNGITTHEVQLLVELDEKYESVKDYLFTNSIFDNTIKDTRIYEYNKQVYLDEAINTIYVGMTRPRANLILCIMPTKGRVKNEVKVSLKNDLLITPIERFFNTTREELIEGGTQTVGKFIPFEENKEDKKTEEFYIDPEVYRKFIDIDNKENNQPKDVKDVKDKYEDIEMTVEKELKRKSGLAIHYYLENIEYGCEEEMKIAKQMTLNKYSNMLGREETFDEIKKVEKFISKNPEVFEKKYTVFKELVLVSFEKEEIDGKEITKKRTHIIDRLNLDEKEKEIIIYDYKSGVSMDREQLERYERVIRDRVGYEYNIKTKFLKLD
jgi:ATP-dependent exoDNAse (exonuclease V) beta subunit